eukprot:TRINITY_DN32266_c0_g1_i1.p1 TRINITY_DN32266_c0_g1~~TRINITY_DN32266_c0_g1_i1.p1  ORF type:complete len:779 (+),score=179.99 TRINITY_DN32266_c0_g1_i1:260-2338(+)
MEAPSCSKFFRASKTSAGSTLVERLRQQLRKAEARRDSEAGHRQLGADDCLRQALRRAVTLTALRTATAQAENEPEQLSLSAQQQRRITPQSGAALRPALLQADEIGGTAKNLDSASAAEDARAAPADNVVGPAEVALQVFLGSGRFILLRGGNVQEGNARRCEKDKELLRSVMAETSSIVVAGSAGGVGTLKWLHGVLGEASIWHLIVHDAALMQNVLEGAAAGKPSAAPASSAPAAALGGAKAAWERLREAGALEAYQLAVGSQLMVALMEMEGVPFNEVGLTGLVAAWSAELTKAEREAQRLLVAPDASGDRRSPIAAFAINLRSPQQLAAAVARWLPADELAAWPRTPCGELRTDAATLRRAAHRLPFAASALRCRELSHAISHYAPYGAMARTGGGRLFPTYRIGGAVTGRMSCANPNLQATPRSPEFRGLVAVSGNRRLLKGDFSQVELRVLAEVSRDERMCRAFAEGEDLHKATAAALLGVDPSDVTSEERQLAKAVNFGLVYGQSALGLQQYAEDQYGVSLTLPEASAAKERFFEVYSGVAAWQRRQREHVRSGTPIRTPAGRIAHHLRRDKTTTASSAASALGRLEREALNFPIQGGAAEVMLATLDRLRFHLRPLRSACRLLCVVHDEFLLECANEKAADAATSALRAAMAEGWQRIFPSAPPLGELGATVGFGRSWADVKG